MDLTEKQLRRLSTALIIGVLGVLVFLAIKPVLLSVLGGLVLGYIFLPVYTRINKKINSPNISATLVLIIMVVIILVPLWILLPSMAQQVFDLFRLSQTYNIQEAMQVFFPTASEQFITQMTVTFSTLVSQASASILNGLVQFLIDIPVTFLHLFIIGFVCFFTMRDNQELRDFSKGISPFSKSKEKILIQHFKSITDSVIYGQIIIGIVQGLLAGLGFLLFGIPSALLLTVLAVLLSVIPIVGPALIWIPLTAYLFATVSKTSAIIFLIYNIFVVTMAENIIRTYIVSKRSKLSQVVVLVGMIGGFFIFGIMGFILGPLILAYFLFFLKSYRDQNLYNLISG